MMARILALLALLAAGPVLAQMVPTEASADALQEGSSHRSFLPVPIIISEPAVGGGLGAALLVFRDRPQGEDGRKVSPDIAGLGGFKTGNGSQGLLAGYSGSLKGDHYRYIVGGGNVDLNLDLYGAADQPRRFALSAPFVLAQGLARIGESDWFAGIRYAYLGSSAQFEREIPLAIPPAQLDAHIGRASLLFDYDTRDNTFTPSKGSYVELDVGAARPALGSTTSWESLMLRGFTWLPIGRSMILGLRGDVKSSRGDVPFYALPFISLRGIPALRYQGSSTYVAETELRYNLGARWAVVGFAGGGKADASDSALVRSRTVGAGGAGVRYLMLPKIGLYVGLDLARGPEDTVVYLQVGGAWK